MTKKHIFYSFHLFCLSLLMISTQHSMAQATKKVEFIGASRTFLTNNQLVVNDSLPDTTTVKRNSGGYSLIDLGVNIAPNKSTEIMGMFRIRNAYGGFWGSGVDFQVRQLWVKGVIANVVRYQLGDLNLKQTPYTFYNHNEDRILKNPDVFSLQADIVDYEKFYQKNTWRQQGASIDFGFNFAKYIKEITFNGFVTRLNMTNFGDVPERLFAGGNVQLIQGKNVRLGYHYTNLFDVVGTILDSNAYANRVQSGVLAVNHSIKDWNLRLDAEAGNSRASYTRDTAAPNMRDFFVNTSLTVTWTPYKSFLKVGYMNVGPDFRSAGAQSKRINYGGLPDFYNRYGNNQTVRDLSLLDVMRNENIYNTSISSNVMAYNPMINNVLPYGTATFNRAGFYGQLQFSTPKDWFVLNIDNYTLSEIRGQGTKIPKNYMLNKAEFTLNLHKVLRSQRMFKVTGGFAMQNTRRKSELDFERIDLNSTNLSAGITYEIFKQFDVLGGAMFLTAKGNEYNAERNKYSQVLDLNAYQVDTRQAIYSGGLRFRFTEKIYLGAFYQHFQYQNKLKLTPDYNINQVLVIYNMTF
ncbi:MAG: hypothetical protein ACKVTZ_06815 [Bacteroidia bacterium]